MVKIISDSTCDLSPRLVERYGISVIPLHILLGSNEYEDGVSITPDDIYKWSDENKTTPKTSAPSMDSVIKVMKPLLDGGNELVCFAISEDMSTSANVMRLAADELEASDRVYVIDSMNLSTGIGHLVIEAAILAHEGKSASEIVDKINQLRPLVRASFVVDTLVYLYRGGRCSGLSAMVGGALKLHPMISVVDGKMIAGKKYRGSLEKVILSYAKDLEESMRHARKDRVFITHSGCDRETVNAVRKYLENLDIFNEILETRAGGVVSSHCGPGTLGVLFISE
jgi:DegV family protein with EDD domain